MTREEIRFYVFHSVAGRMTCKEVVEIITDYLEGNLTLLEWIRFHLHLGLCQGCRVYLRQMKQTIRTLGRLPQAPAPPIIQAELLRRFRAWKHT